MPAGARTGISAKSFAVVLSCITAVGLAFRLAYLALGGNTSVSGDGGYYHSAANYLADGKGYVDPIAQFFAINLPGADHPPAWTTLLGAASWLGFRSKTDHEVVACLVGAATIALVGLAGRRLGGPRVGLIAAAIAAFYPNFWMYEYPILSETLAILGVAVTVLLALRFQDRPTLRRAGALGAVCGVLTLVRAEQVLLFGLLILPLTLLVSDVPIRRRLEWFGVALGAGVLVISPWMIYNLDRYQEATLLTTNFGGAIAIANCDSVYHGPNIGFWDPRCYHSEELLGVTNTFAVPVALADRHEDGSILDSQRRQIGLRYAREHLGDLPAVVVAREGRTWGLYRRFQQLHLDLVSGEIWVLQAGLFSYWILAALAVGGAYALRRRKLTLWVLASFVAVVFVTTAITFGQTRYRAPADVAVVLFAAVAVDRLIGRMRSPARAPEARRSRRERLPSVYVPSR